MWPSRFILRYIQRVRLKEIKRKTIKIYKKDNGGCPFVLWLESLDATTRHRIQSRLARVTLDNLGVSDGLNELKFKFGSGYRIYYSEFDDVIVLLLYAGNKKTQSKDIKLAKEYLKDYLEGVCHG